MHAIIETGGKQYRVAEADTLCIETRNAEAGEAVTCDSVVKNGKGKKVMIFKYNPKKGYRRRQGHRQPYTKVQIEKIEA